MVIVVSLRGPEELPGCPQGFCALRQRRALVLVGNEMNVPLGERNRDPFGLEGFPDREIHRVEDLEMKLRRHPVADTDVDR